MLIRVLLYQFFEVVSHLQIQFAEDFCIQKKLFLQGDGTAVDKGKAIKYFKMAVDAGYSNSMFCFENMLNDRTLAYIIFIKKLIIN